MAKMGVSNAIMDCLLLLLDNADATQYHARLTESNGHAPVACRTASHEDFGQHYLRTKKLNGKRRRSPMLRRLGGFMLAHVFWIHVEPRGVEPVLLLVVEVGRK